jgi:hypothetical protein
MPAIPDFVGFIISIALMASTIVISSGLILRTRPLPYAHALLIATVANGLGKMFVSMLHWPGVISYSLPTLSFLVLSWLLFKPSPIKLLTYWLFGFVLYLLTHVFISSLFGWTFMFPFWRPRLF